MDTDPLAHIKAFVAGELSAVEFRDRLYSDDAFEALLAHDPNLRHGNYVGRSVFHYLLDLDFADPGGVLNAQGALRDYMDRNGIDYTATSKYGDFYDLVLDVQPKWCQADHRFVQDHIMPHAAGRTGKELRAWLKAEIPRHYRYASKPPRWLQDPHWPHSANGPLVFLGQVDLDRYFHDTATILVFHDQAAGTYETVVQVM